MRRKQTTTRKVEILLDVADVRHAILSMARVPVNCRDVAVVKQEGKDYVVSWVETPQARAERHERTAARKSTRWIPKAGDTFWIWTLVSEGVLRRYPSRQTRQQWTVKCPNGHKRDVDGGRLRGQKPGPPKTCRECWAAAERRCRFCGDQLELDSPLVSVCGTHSRQFERAKVHQRERGVPETGLCLRCGDWPEYAACPGCGHQYKVAAKRAAAKAGRNGTDA